MQNLKFLNKKEVKQIASILEKKYGFNGNLEYVFMKNEKNKVYVVDDKIKDIDLTKLRVNSIGLYMGELGENSIRLSIEGSQLIGPFAKKNVIELDDENSKKWLKGDDLDIESDFTGFVIIKHKEDYLGCGKFSNGRILNHVSKVRRINS